MGDTKIKRVAVVMRGGDKCMNYCFKTFSWWKLPVVSDDSRLNQCNIKQYFFILSMLCCSTFLSQHFSIRCLLVMILYIGLPLPTPPHRLRASGDASTAPSQGGSSLQLEHTQRKENEKSASTRETGSKVSILHVFLSEYVVCVRVRSTQ